MKNPERIKAVKAVVASLLGQVAEAYEIDTIADAAKDFVLNSDRKSPHFQGKHVAAANNKLGEQLIEAIQKII